MKPDARRIDDGSNADHNADLNGGFNGGRDLVLGTDTILYGGDYNPEQWPREVWARDMELFKEAGITTVTLNVFSWATLQPSEDVYDFSQLDAIIQTVTDAGLAIVLATSTAALPPWMALRHPDVNRVDMHGRQMRHGRRHNACMSSPTYLHYSAKLAGKLAERYGQHPLLVAWHVSNEYGGFCYCDLCAAGFREWLQEKYGTIAAVNQAWNTAFWSHTFHSFDEIFPYSALGDLIEHDLGHKAVLPAYALDYRRFYGQRVREAYLREYAAIRQHDANTPITTNLMGTFNDYDYFEWSDLLDIVSWDSYPAYDTSAAELRLRNDLMRAIGKQKPWMLMEQTPSRQNWQPYNSLKRPGQMRQMSWQAIARGADTVQFFQLRQSRSGSEKFHGAVISANGTNQTREFREVAELGAELAAMSDAIIGSVVEPGAIGIIFDWPSRWGIEFSAGPSVSLNYVSEVVRWYSEVYRRNIPVDIVPARGQDLSKYPVVIAPCLYMLEDAAITELRAYVAGGGRLVLTPMSALADANDSLFQGPAPVPFRDLAGIWIDETDALPPGVSVPLEFTDTASDFGKAPERPAEPGRIAEPEGVAEPERVLKAEDGLSSGDVTASNVTVGGPAGDILCDVLHPDPETQVLATYGGEYFTGSPALTFKASTGSGGVFYAATMPNEAAIGKMLDLIISGTAIEQLAIPMLPAGVEISRRIHPDGRAITFIINTTNHAHKVHYRDTELKLAPHGVEIIAEPFQT